MNDELLTYIGDNEQVCDVEGWPNNKGDGGQIVPTSLLETGKFNSPHGLAVDANGNLFVAEWLIGGRVTKLNRSLRARSLSEPTEVRVGADPGFPT